MSTIQGIIFILLWIFVIIQAFIYLKSKNINYYVIKCTIVDENIKYKGYIDSNKTENQEDVLLVPICVKATNETIALEKYVKFLQIPFHKIKTIKIDRINFV